METPYRVATRALTHSAARKHNLSFEELYAALPLDKCGYSAEELTDASSDDMLEYYTKEQIEKYGVVGIEIEMVPDH